MTMTRRELFRNGLAAAAVAGASLYAARYGLTAPGTAAPAHHFAVTHTDAEWKKLLKPAQYHILREAGTERLLFGSDWPFVGHEDRITYRQTIDWFDSFIPNATDRNAIGRTAARFYRFA